MQIALQIKHRATTHLLNPSNWENFPFTEWMRIERLEFTRRYHKSFAFIMNDNITLTSYGIFFNHCLKYWHHIWVCQFNIPGHVMSRREIFDILIYAISDVMTICRTINEHRQQFYDALILIRFTWLCRNVVCGNPNIFRNAASLETITTTTALKMSSFLFWQQFLTETPFARKTLNFVYILHNRRQRHRECRTKTNTVAWHVNTIFGPNINLNSPCMAVCSVRIHESTTRKSLLCSRMLWCRHLLTLVDWPQRFAYTTVNCFSCGCCCPWISFSTRLLWLGGGGSGNFGFTAITSAIGIDTRSVNHTHIYTKLG